MWLPVSTIAALCVLLEVAESGGSQNELEDVFRDRSKSDWEDVWHNEKHARCREKLIRHLYWACEKDIYRLTRRSDPALSNSVDYLDEDLNTDNNIDIDDESKRDYDYPGFPWLAPKKAKSLLRFRRGVSRRGGSSITKECCKSSGCTWEEYAEYCPTNKRYTSYV